MLSFEWVYFVGHFGGTLVGDFGGTGLSICFVSPLPAEITRPGPASVILLVFTPVMFLKYPRSYDARACIVAARSVLPCGSQ